MVATLPGVGENLQDHMETYVQYECTQPITLFSATKPLKMAAIGVELVSTTLETSITSSLWGSSTSKRCTGLR